MNKRMFVNVIIVLLSMVSVSAFAADGSWTNTIDGLWITGTNWSTNPTPPGSTTLTTNTDTATFGNAITAISIITIDPNRNVQSILFTGNSGGFVYTLSGSPLLLTTGGKIDNSSGLSNTITSPIELQGNAGTATFTSNGANSQLTIGSGTGAVTGVSTLGNTPVLTLNGTSTESGNIVEDVIGDGLGGGKLAVTKDGIGTWILNNVNTYTGDTTVKAGILTDSGTIADTSNLIVNGGTFELGLPDTVGKVTLTGGTITGTTLNTLTSSQAYDLQNGTVSAVLAGGIGIGLTKTTTGRVILSSANTYRGLTEVKAGILHVDTIAGTLGDTTSGTIVTADAALELDNVNIGNEALTLNGTGVTSQGALRNTGGTSNYVGGITLASDARINASSGTLNLNGATITGNFDLTVGTTTGSAKINIDNSISTGTGTLTKDGTGTLTLSGANSYTGLTDVHEGTLAYGASDVIANAASIKVSGGTLNAARLI